MPKMDNGALQDKDFIRLSGRSQKITHIMDMIHKVADSNASVLITGESGTGKEIAGRLLHYYSNRKNEPFVAVNCGAIPHDLLESELFGHVKGAFTGAITDRTGRFELAHNGTIFLDEIGDMPLSMQVKMLRIIQERMFEKIGSNKSIQVNVRIIAATHRDLEEEIKQGKFREDLYYRLNVFPIHMPALRERKEDVSDIIQDLIIRFKAQFKQGISLDCDVIHSISNHPLSGNIRELSNLIERLFILFPNQKITYDMLPEKYQTGQSQKTDNDSKRIPDEEVELNIQLKHHDFTQPVLVRHPLQHENFDLKTYLSNLEQAYITEALKISEGVVAHAAQCLGMRRTTLVEKMKKYQLLKGL